MTHIQNIQPESTLMFQEAAQAGERLALQFQRNAQRVADLAEQLRNTRPRALVTCARGSSDHAATYAKYLVETQLGLITASAAPSIGSVYRSHQDLDSVLFVAISQSGKSPDLITNLEQAKAAGALTLALVNVEDSPLAQAADWVLPLHAGPELSVAATKSYIASLGALLHLVAAWSGNPTLDQAREQLPDQLERAWQLDWQAAVQSLTPVNNLFVVARGLGLGIAQEAALKLKETCALHAEAFSAAEVKHGPMALVGKDFPVLILTQPDETQASTRELAQEFLQRGAKVLLTGNEIQAGDALPVITGAHAATAPILAIQSFYRMANGLSLARGLHPDEPPHLRKVTETV